MNRIVKVCFLIFLFVLALTCPLEVHALSISISNLPESVDKDQETEIELFFSCAGCGDSYFRGVFYPSGTNYFGFTQNNSGNWIGTVTDRSQYYLIAKENLVDASWSGKLKIKPDSGDAAYSGPGEYLFKVGRYTSAGDSSADWSNELAVKITGPTPTPAPTPTPISTPTPTVTPSKTPIPTRTPTPFPKKTPVPTPTDTPEGRILGEETIFPSPTVGVLAQTEEGNQKNKFPFLAIVLIIAGVGLTGFSVFSIIKSAKKSYTIESENENNQIS